MLVTRAIVLEKAKKIKWVFTDCDGVLTDSGIFYSSNGDELKRFSIRDGMGVERLRKICNIETGIITGEFSIPVKKRAKKLEIKELHLDIKNKLKCMKEITERLNLRFDEIAYIGDDVNDHDLLKVAGLSCSPSDAFSEIKEIVDYITPSPGGNGAFRDLCELIIYAKQSTYS